MVEFSSKDRISLIKQLIEEQKKQEEAVKKEEEELKKKQEELDKKKEETKKKKEEVDVALEDALEEESKDFQEAEKFRRTDVQLQPSQTRMEETATPSKEKKEESEEIQEKPGSSEASITYRRMPQPPNPSQVYQQLETIYQHIPQENASRSTFQQAQRQIYHELKAMANHWGTQRTEVEAPKETAKAYGREILEDPNSESSTFSRLSDRVRAMAERAGADEFAYQQRTEIVLNQLRHRLEEKEYIARDNKDELR